VVQNLEAGGSFGMARDAFFDIGGFDESFVGWGGEDNEFWERAQTRSVWPFGYVPLVHLWHEPQPEKLNPKRYTAEVSKSRSSIPALTRIQQLRERNSQASISGI
jgi:GT2 family glycosyltransferase